MFDVTTSDLMHLVNDDKNQGDKLSKFSVIVAIAKRARQLVENQDERILTDNPVTIAVDEFMDKDVSVVVDKG